jgi:hypothetical protein
VTWVFTAEMEAGEGGFHGGFALAPKEQASTHDAARDSPTLAKGATKFGVQKDLTSAEKRAAAAKRGLREKMDADLVLETLVGHEVYVYGTGGARETRRNGVLRKVDLAMPVEVCHRVLRMADAYSSVPSCMLPEHVDQTGGRFGEDRIARDVHGLQRLLRISPELQKAASHDDTSCRHRAISQTGAHFLSSSFSLPYSESRVV